MSQMLNQIALYIKKNPKYYMESPKFNMVYYCVLHLLVVYVPHYCSYQ